MMFGVGIGAIIAYSIVILAITVRTSRRKVLTNTNKKFFLGTGTKTFVLLFTTLASTFSSWVFMGAPASTYTMGHPWIGMITMYQMTLAFTCGYLGPRFWVLRQENDYLTQADLVVDYYKVNSMRYVIGGCYIVALVTNVIAQFKAMGTAISVMSDGVIPYWAAALYTAVLVGVYVYFGGFHGQSLVDTFQGLLFTALLWGGLLIAVFHSGGFFGMFDSLVDKSQDLILYLGADALWNPRFAISFCLVAILGGPTTAGFWQRYYAAKDTRALVKMSLWFPLLVSIGVSFSGGLVGLSGNLFQINLTAPDAVFQTVLSTISSPIWNVLVVVGVICAAMSTVAGSMNGSAMIVSNDFIKHIQKNPSDDTIRKTGRYSVLVLIALGYLLSLNTPSSVTMLIQLTTAFYMTALYPLIGIFIWKRATVPGVFAAMIGSFSTICLTNFIVKNPFDIVAGAWGFAVGMTLLIVVSLLTKPIPEAQRAAFLKPLRESKTYAQTVIK